MVGGRDPGRRARHPPVPADGGDAQESADGQRQTAAVVSAAPAGDVWLHGGAGADGAGPAAAHPGLPHARVRRQAPRGAVRGGGQHGDGRRAARGGGQDQARLHRAGRRPGHGRGAAQRGRLPPHPRRQRHHAAAPGRARAQAQGRQAAPRQGHDRLHRARRRPARRARVAGRAHERGPVRGQEPAQAPQPLRAAHGPVRRPLLHLLALGAGPAAGEEVHRQHQGRVRG
ncbi:hypothetical protein ON010_g5359 [Phytophthora cinnamomi]|nr:hypothetical protein ON010_g5359 [Phytophthora cinnamomi]